MAIGTKGRIESRKMRNSYIAQSADIVELVGPEKADKYILDSPQWSDYAGAISIKLDNGDSDTYLAHTYGKIYHKSLKPAWWKIITNTDKKNATFFAKPGLDGGSDWTTFESCNYPGCYIKLGYEVKYTVWKWRWWPPPFSYREVETSDVEKLCIICRGDSSDSETEFNVRATFRFI